MIAEMFLRVSVSARVALRDGSSRSGVGVFALAEVLPLLSPDERAAVGESLVRVPLIETFCIGAGSADVFDLRPTTGEREPLALASSTVTAETVAAAIRARITADAAALSGAAPN